MWVVEQPALHDGAGSGCGGSCSSSYHNTCNNVGADLNRQFMKRVVMVVDSISFVRRRTMRLSFVQVMVVVLVL
jgi:hypothetical protein